jgi:hypothetical protein
MKNLPIGGNVTVTFEFFALCDECFTYIILDAIIDSECERKENDQEIRMGSYVFKGTTQKMLRFHS